MKSFRRLIPRAKAIPAIVAICSLALASGLPFRCRVDLTDNGRYSLSPYAKKALTNLDSEVKVTWYRSRDIGRYAPDWREVEGCLNDFRSASRGRFTYDVRDPSASDARVTPESLGIQGRGETNAYYSGILVEHGGNSDVLPFVADRSRLEYDLLVRINSLSSTKRPEVQVIVAAPGGVEACPYVMPWLEYSRFRVRSLALPAIDIDARIPLVVIGSTNVDNLTADAIDSFLDAGGNAAFFVSGATVATGGDWSASVKSGDPLLAILARRGAVIDDGIIMDESCWRMTLPAVDGSKYEQIDYPYWPRVYPPYAASRDGEALAGGVGTLQFYWPSGILIDRSKDPLLHPVIESGEGAIVDRSPFSTDPFAKGMDRLRSREGKSRKHLAVASESRGRVIVVADELFPGTMGDYTGSDANLDFLVNCAEWISREDGSLSARKTWPSASAPTASEIGAMAEYYARVRVAMLIVVPSTVIVSYAIARLLRKKRRA